MKSHCMHWMLQLFESNQNLLKLAMSGSSTYVNLTNQTFFKLEEARQISDSNAYSGVELLP